MTYIYGLIDPRTNKIRYVGKADNPKQRLKLHLRDKARCHRVNWIQCLLHSGLVPVMVILEEVDNMNWQEAEKRWIKNLKAEGIYLVNSTSGGGGLLEASEETRQKIRVKAIGRNHSEETKRKMSETRQGHKGCIHSEETRRKWSLIRKGKALGCIHTEESRRKIGLAQRERKRLPLTEEQRYNLSKVQMGHTVSEETRKKISDGNKGKKSLPYTDERRRKIGEASRLAWQRKKETQQAIF